MHRTTPRISSSPATAAWGRSSGISKVPSAVSTPDQVTKAQENGAKRAEQIIKDVQGCGFLILPDLVCRYLAPTTTCFQETPVNFAGEWCGAVPHGSLNDCSVMDITQWILHRVETLLKRPISIAAVFQRTYRRGAAYKPRSTLQHHNLSLKLQSQPWARRPRSRGTLR